MEQHGYTPDFLKQNPRHGEEIFLELAMHWPSMVPLLSIENNHPVNPKAFGAYLQRLYPGVSGDILKNYESRADEINDMVTYPAAGVGMILSTLAFQAGGAAILGPVGAVLGGAFAYKLHHRNMKALDENHKAMIENRAATKFKTAYAEAFRSFTSSLESIYNTKLNANLVKDSTLQRLRGTLGLVLQGYYKIARNETKVLKLPENADALDRDLVLKIEALATEERASNTDPTKLRVGIFEGMDVVTTEPCPTDYTGSDKIRELFDL